MDSNLITLPSSLDNISNDDSITSFDFDFAMCHGPYLYCRYYKG